MTDDQSWVGTSIHLDPDDARSKSDYYQTPAIERLGAEGMRFTRGYAPAPYCCPTRRSLQVGQTPARHIYQRDQRGWLKRYRQQLTIPNMLKHADPRYRSAHFGKWDMRFDEVTPEQLGYDVSDGPTNNGTGGGRGSGGPEAQDDPKQIFGITERACNFMAESVKAARPFYVQVSHYAVHLDIYYRQQTLAKTRSWENGKKHSMPEFAAMTADVDTGIGQLLDKIKSLGIEESTYVFFLSDNGGRNGMPGQKRPELHRNDPLRDGKGSMYEGGLRVPFIVRGPNIEAGAICHVPVTGLDIFPTIAELAGYEAVLPDSLDGGSMKNLLLKKGKGKVKRSNPFLVFHQAVARPAESALIHGDYKLVKDWKGDNIELFDLSKSPSEQKDLSKNKPQKARELHRMLIEYLEQVGAETTKTGSKAEVYKNATSRNEPLNERPNVLLLSIDDLNDWVGTLDGHPQAITPNLDRLFEQSVVFSNAHCTAPVCSASRHSLLSGLRPSTTGWYTNARTGLESYERVLTENNTVPLPTHFKQHGYTTLAAGKIFHKGTSDVAGYDYWTRARPKYKWPKKLASRGHGYQGKSGGHFYPFPSDGGAIYQKYDAGVDGQGLCWGALEEDDIPAEGMPDEQIAAWAVNELKREHDKPFFLAVGFVRPHVPYTAPKRYFDLYPLDKIATPKVPADEMDDIPLHGKAMAYGSISGGDHWNVLNIGPNYWREMTRAYLACVSFVDAQAGKVLEALEQSAYADNTIVVLWSDHGQHIGEKHHWRKQALWEESTRVPLAVLVPKSKMAGKTCSKPASLLDVYPTLVELCDLSEVSGLEGESLVDQLEDINAPRAQPAVTTWHYNNHAVRDDRWRYIRYRDGSEELYDHKSDPGEHVNLAKLAEHAATKERLNRHLPEVNVMPKSIKGGGLDSHGKKVERLQEDGIPAWLGKVPNASSSKTKDNSQTSSLLSFGKAGKFKMLYDCRQRPQSVYIGGRVYIVYNGEAEPTSNDKGSAYPMLISYDRTSKQFSDPVRLSEKSSTDHHFSPIIWADNKNHLHVLHGCHKTPGIHLVSKRPVANGRADIEWRVAPQIAPSISYPTVYTTHENTQVIYYRTGGHTSAWSFRISDDNGQTWSSPDSDVTDLDLNGPIDWSSYQTKMPSADGRYLHVAYTDYDDNKTNPDPKRFYNPRYRTEVTNSWKYNLSYLKIDLKTRKIYNSAGEILLTPINRKQSYEHCRIWDTQWRGAGIPPVIALDSDGDPTFMHVLSSEEDISKQDYYYVRHVDGRWVHTRICAANDQWNSGYLKHDREGHIHAYVLVGDDLLAEGYMDRHGGGRVEEWVSDDAGETWRKHRKLTDEKAYAGWRFNNIQPVVDAQGQPMDGMLLFYGWNDAKAPQAVAFLLDESSD